MYSIDRDPVSGAKPRWRDYFAAARQALVPGPLRFERAMDYLAISPAARASH